MTYTQTVHNIKFSCSERRCYLVFNDLYTHMVSDDFCSVLDCLNAPYIKPYARIEFKCTAAGRNLRISVNNADLFTELVDEYCDTV